MVKTPVPFYPLAGFGTPWRARIACNFVSFGQYGVAARAGGRILRDELLLS
jgi:hypothetical protein